AAMADAPVPVACRRMVLPRRRLAAEERLKVELDRELPELLISVGFAAAADQRLKMGELLQATRLFGGADVYLDLPPLQAPGATRGALCSLDLETPPEPARPSLTPAARQRRLPPVYAFDDSAFWIARQAQAANLPCLVLRAILLPSTEAEPDPVLQSLRHFRLAELARRRGLASLPDLARAAGRCRRQLAATLSILLVLHSQTRPTPAG
ncbi:MAG TPA: hypothetical protein VFS62_13565, partial [Chloroflexota bacterium]|nr:hypothetical protein [Chloroflexota bacterium]